MAHILVIRTIHFLHVFGLEFAHFHIKFPVPGAFDHCSLYITNSFQVSVLAINLNLVEFFNSNHLGLKFSFLLYFYGPDISCH